MIRDNGDGIVLYRENADFNCGALIISVANLIRVGGFKCPIVFSTARSIRGPNNGNSTANNGHRCIRCLTGTTVTINISKLFVRARRGPSRT